MNYSKRIIFNKPIVVDLKLLEKIYDLFSDYEYALKYSFKTELKDSIEIDELTDLKKVSNEKCNKINSIEIDIYKNKSRKGYIEFKVINEYKFIGKKFKTIDGYINVEDDREGNTIRDNLYKVISKNISENEWFYYRSLTDFFMVPYVVYLFMFNGFSEIGYSFYTVYKQATNNIVIFLVVLITLFGIIKFYKWIINYYDELFPIILFDINDEENLKDKISKTKSNIFWTIIVGLIVGVVGGIITSLIMGQ